MCEVCVQMCHPWVGSQRRMLGGLLPHSPPYSLDKNLELGWQPAKPRSACFPSPPPLQDGGYRYAPTHVASYRGTGESELKTLTLVQKMFIDSEITLEPPIFTFLFKLLLLYCVCVCFFTAYMHCTFSKQTIPHLAKMSTSHRQIQCLRLLDTCICKIKTQLQFKYKSHLKCTYIKLQNISDFMSSHH